MTGWNFPTIWRCISYLKMVIFPLSLGVISISHWQSHRMDIHRSLHHRRMSPLRWSLIALFWARNHLRCITWGWFPPTGAMEMKTINLGTGPAGSSGFRGRWRLVGSSGWTAGGVLMLLNFPFCVECCWSVDGLEEALLWGLGGCLTNTWHVEGWDQQRKLQNKSLVGAVKSIQTGPQIQFLPRLMA